MNSRALAVAIAVSAAPTVADLDRAGLGEALQRFAHRLPVDPQRLRQRSLGRQLVTGLELTVRTSPSCSNAASATDWR